MTEIVFLNIDLDIESDEDLSALVTEMSARASVMRNGWEGSLYCASFETSASGENGIVEEYASIVDDLTAECHKLWKGCSKREFDFGYESGEGPNDFHSLVSAHSIESIARLGGSIAITIYPNKEMTVNRRLVSGSPC